MTTRIMFQYALPGWVIGLVWGAVSFAWHGGWVEWLVSAPFVWAYLLLFNFACNRARREEAEAHDRRRYRPR